MRCNKLRHWFFDVIGGTIACCGPGVMTKEKRHATCGMFYFSELPGFPVLK